MAQEKQVVELTEEEMQLLQEARAAKAKKEADEKKERDIKAYKALVDSAIETTINDALAINEQMTQMKVEIMDRFKTVIGMKEELFGGKIREGRYSDSFTNQESTKRVSIGYNTTDAYDDTYTAGVEMVKEYIESLASDEKSSQLADMVTTLLKERSKSGQLKAQNVLRLENMAAETGDEKFIEGMKIIRNAYKPERTKIFVKVEQKDDNGEWQNITMTMTNV